MSARCGIHRRGEGPDLVMVSGWGMHAGVWGSLADALSEHHQLHLVELPGHGRGEAGPWALEDTIDQVLETTPAADWLGWSLGGTLALRAALRAREQVHSLALLGVNPCFVAREGWPWGTCKADLDTFRARLAAHPRIALERFLALFVAGSAQEYQTLAALRQAVFSADVPDASALNAGLDILEQENLVEDLHRIDTPALWISGERDRVTPAGAAAEAARRMPQARYQQIDGAGHAAFISHPDEVLSPLQSWLGMEQPA